MLPFLTPFLTNTDYGIFGIIMSITTGATVIKGLGLDMILMNSFIHHYKSKRYKFIWNEVQGFIFLWSIVLGLLIGLLIYGLLPTEAIKDRGLIITLTITPIIFYSSLQIVSTKYYQLAEEPIQIGYRSLIFGVLSIVLNYYLIVLSIFQPYGLHNLHFLLNVKCVLIKYCSPYDFDTF